MAESGVALLSACCTVAWRRCCSSWPKAAPLYPSATKSLGLMLSISVINCRSWLAIGIGSSLRTPCKARQPSMDRIVALKVLPQRLAKDADFVARFLREARSAGRLNHTGIVQAFDAGEADGYYYLAMEFVNGPSLEYMLKMNRVVMMLGWIYS